MGRGKENELKRIPGGHRSNRPKVYKGAKHSAAEWPILVGDVSVCLGDGADQNGNKKTRS